MDSATIVMPPRNRQRRDSGETQPAKLIILDPSVEVLGVTINGARLLAHHHFETGLAVPPGEGLLDLVDDIARGASTQSDLHQRYAEHDIVDAIVDVLVDAGFAYLVASPPDAEALAALRASVAARRAREQRVPLLIDLDTPEAVARLAALPLDPAGLDLRLVCARLGDHQVAIAALATRKRAGTLRLYDVAIRTHDARADHELRNHLFALDAAVVIDRIQWPSPETPVAGLVDLTRDCIAVHAAMKPGSTIFAAEVRDRAIAWGAANAVTGLRLHLDPDALWPSGGDAEAAGDLIEAMQALEEGFGDVSFDTVPSDATILGVEPADPLRLRANVRMAALRHIWLHGRLAQLKAFEGDNLWSQIPEVEDKLVRSEDDLLPARPDLLGLTDGARLVDVCGGLGRVARRLAPHLGTTGKVVSIEMLRLLSDRARDFAVARGFDNISFRTGLAQRIPLADGSMDAAVNEWTGGIWELGLGDAMLNEMVRVVRPGGMVAVTHRLVRLQLLQLSEPWVQYDAIYDWIRGSFAQSGLIDVTERIWGQMTPTLVGERATQWRKQYVRSIIDPFDFAFESEAQPGAKADVFVTFLGRKVD